MVCNITNIIRAGVWCLACASHSAVSFEAGIGKELLCSWPDVVVVVVVVVVVEVVVDASSGP